MTTALWVVRTDAEVLTASIALRNLGMTATALVAASMCSPGSRLPG